MNKGVFAYVALVVACFAAVLAANDFIIGNVAPGDVLLYS